MNEERNKFLTEVMGECRHEFYDETSKGCLCKTCGLDLKCLNLQHTDFSTWKGFGTLWEWAYKQNWWKPFVFKCNLIDDVYHMNTSVVNPDKFADAVYQYLKEAA